MADPELAPQQNDVIAALKGQTLRVPDLTTLFGTWPRAATNPHLPEIRTLVDGAIRRMAATGAGQAAHIDRRLRDDIGLLACLWYPRADNRTMQALATFSAWLLCWDDTVDANEGDLSRDLAGANAWRTETLRVAREAMGLDEQQQQSQPSPANPDAVNAVLCEFGSLFVASGASIAQRRALYDELSLFAQSCAAEQKLRLEGRILGYDDYMAMRLDTVAGYLLCSLLDLADGRPRALASEILQTGGGAEHVKILMRQVCVLLSLLNDTLSLKKELSTDCVINVVASLLTPGRTLDNVVGEVYNRMRESVAVFDAAAETLMSQVRGEAEELTVKRYIDGCRSIVTGTLEFTLRSPRYNISKLLREDGSLEITL